MTTIDTLTGGREEEGDKLALGNHSEQDNGVFWIQDEFSCMSSIPKIILDEFFNN